ncbi:ABC transporter ATP-binding protein [Coprococcus eutactus]|jgi:ATP-binding cassette subfamily B multidrug efflux pump|uniref:ABC transporter ATP-binding protein n=1 Tax=Coprococcus TaxID=33042 RepID=UPI0008205F7D|nr:ABC transporter ATP-binding protein [Coprococcus eutactus]RGH09496.1 ABC transporter ATP-binding protein [Clostridium sp. AF15-31]SCI28828.1 Probable multidrug resistance ABC transporter ATP-binding/permease protein YheI [uncultured Coprococcus sp.]
MQIIKNLKPYWKSVLIIVLLLIVQAYCDLALPDYTSKLIDTGIQNYGIDHCSPLQIPEKAYTIIKGFMDEDDVTVWEKYYEQSDDGIYRMTDDGKDHIDEIDQACMEPMMMYYYPYTMVDSDEDNQLKQMLAASGMTLDELPPEMWSQMGTQMKQMIDSMRDSMGDDMMMSSAITCTRTCYDSMDYNYKDIQMSYLKRVGVEMILMTLLMVASAVLTGLVAARVAAGVGCDLRESIFKRVISFSDAEINRFSTASLITRSTNDVQQIQMVTVMLLRMVLYAPVLAVGGIIKVVESGASMGWVIVVAVAGILVVLGVLMAIALPKFKIMQDLVDRVNLVSREILTGIPVIRAFGREKFEEERFDKANKDLTKTSLFVNRVMTFMMPVLMFIMYAVTILIEWVAAHRIDSGELQVGSMTAFITYTMMIIMSFLMIGMLSVMLPRAGVAADRIKEVIDTESTICDKPDCKKLEAVKGVVRYEHVSFAYPGADEDVLTDLDFEARPGETTAIIGSTGCGKSSLVQLMPRFYDVTGGKITIDGTDIRDVSIESLRENIGYVPQKGVLFSGTIASNIRFGAEDASDEQMKKAAAIAQATDFIEEKDKQYDSSISQGGTNVSGGQKQRLAIARAVARNAKIYIFDDSFSALDFKTDVAVRKALREDMTDSTVFIVAQRVSTILHADQILVLDEGKIVGKGTHKELMENCPVYEQIARSQLSEKEIAASIA